MTTIQRTEEIHISDLAHGDTIILADGAETVNSKNITNGFTGMSYKGDTFRETKGMIEVALFPKWFQGEITGWHRKF